MSTTNLKLEEIILDDTLNGTMLEKMNSNMQKIDEKYGELKEALLEQTGKETLEEAIVYVQTLANHIDFLNSSGDATTSEILSGKSAVIKGQVVTGTIPIQEEQTIIPSTENQTIASGRYLNGTQTIRGDANLIPENIVSGKSIFGVSGNMRKRQTINVTLTGSYASQISGYGAGINQDGTLVIWAMTNTTTYEAISFSANSIIGTQGNGWGITGFDTSNPSGVPYACTISDLSNYDTLNVTLDASSRNGTNDYTGISVTVTGS